MPSKVWISWSSGKDSAFGFFELKRQSNYEISGLLTTVNESFNRVAMHSTRAELLSLQAQEISQRLIPIQIPYPCSNKVYAEKMAAAIRDAQREGVTHMMFGDLFLEDVRRYREEMLSQTGITPIFPLWQRPTARLAEEIIDSGFKAIVTCVDPKQLSASFAGREFDQSFIRDLPVGVDPCGERGEFHTLVYDGPIFKKPIDVRVGEIIERDGFVFADVVPCKAPPVIA